MTSIETPAPCSHCKKLLPPSTLLLHEAYCYRKMVKCPDCEEMIDKSDDFSHKKTHERVNCSHCHESLPVLQLEDHLEQCAKKPRTCEFCKIPYSYSEFKPHQIQCGSRTRVCEICGKYIQLREFVDHEEKCLILMSLKDQNNGSKNNMSLMRNSKKIEISSGSEEEYTPEVEEKKSLKNDSKEYETRKKTTSVAPMKKPNELKEKLRKPKKITSYEERMSDEEELLFQEKNKPKLKKIKDTPKKNIDQRQEIDDLEFARSLQAQFYQEEAPAKNTNSKKSFQDLAKNAKSQKSYQEIFKRKK